MRLLTSNRAWKLILTIKDIYKFSSHLINNKLITLQTIDPNQFNEAKKMKYDQEIALDQSFVDKVHHTERVVNKFVRGYDYWMGKLHLGGRKGDYDDINYEFNGGTNDTLRKKHYDKSFRLLWKAEENMPWSSFRDCTKEENELRELADQSLNSKERAHLKKMSTQEYKDLINKAYTQKQKQAIVNILATIGHGEAYAWMVSTEVLHNAVKGTGARAALTMQVVEEAKHFVVLRELIQAFDCPIPRLSIWEYMLLEGCLKARGIKKFFGMNVVVEGFALNLFGQMSTLPGLEILKLFHRDESRHTALPSNYLKDKPLTWWQSRSLPARLGRLFMIIPALPFVTYMEKDFATLGLDIYDFTGSMMRKVVHLSERVEFYFPLPGPVVLKLLNDHFNRMARKSRAHPHEFRNYHKVETTEGKTELQTEKEVFELNQAVKMKIAS